MFRYGALLIVISVLIGYIFPGMNCLAVAQGDESPGLPLMSNKDASTNIGISLTADKAVAKPGDEITLVARTDRDCYLTVMSLGVSGKVTVLWPNRETGWNNHVSARETTRIAGPGAAFRIQVDGSQRFENILAYATSEKDAIFQESDFRELPGGQAKAFAGHLMEFSYQLRARLTRIPGHVKWGTSELLIEVLDPHRPVGASRPTKPERQARAKDDQPGAPFAIRAFSGTYLSLKGGKVSFSAKEIGPTEIFRFQFLKNGQVKLVGHDNACLLSPGAGNDNSERRQMFDIYPFAGQMIRTTPELSAAIVGFFGIGFRSFDGKYLTASPHGGQEAVFNTCSPDMRTRDGFFTLIPLKDPSPQKKSIPSQTWWLPVTGKTKTRQPASQAPALVPK